ncbi:hypothetical protein BDW42DRAFT_67984 [Aspergillus taichungensis]|uniref:Inheritance of peroxisomes protein 1 n=1 Tax=Aspergillus taichungensis TaxID=482145 RepID=A0A2J5I0N5_9EURO|nr:hypothetical protein BDW42DRAFT_67984 [Aspergillus taichungensis]
MASLSDAPLHAQSIRRSVTVPVSLTARPHRRSVSFQPSENDLFYHPAAKVVHFAPRAVAPIPSSTAPSDFDYPVDAVETLPWRSPTERTVAFAPLRLEKLHGLAVFLKCGSVVHAILKNSQCWCVDGESTFVLRIRPLTYYRIELPNITEEDKGYVTALKAVLPTVLRYEITPCPFKRGFTVSIPETAKAPRPKKAWRPKGRRESAPIYSLLTREKSPTRAVADLAPDVLSAGEETDGNLTDDSSLLTRGSNSTLLETIPDDNEANEPSSLELSAGAQSVHPHTNPVPRVAEPPRRSVSEARPSFPTLLARFDDRSEPPAVPDLPLASSVESFHSLEPRSPLESDSRESRSPLEFDSPSEISAPVSFDETTPPPDAPRGVSENPTGGPKTLLGVDSSDRFFSAPRDSLHSRLTATPSPIGSSDRKSSVSAESARSTESNPYLSDMSAEFRRRSRASRAREVSPMPPPSILVTSGAPDPDAASILHKTCTLVLVPPIQLLIVLLHIAARIVIGPGGKGAIGDLDRKFECQITNSQEAVDDFDLPLALDCPRRRSEGPPDPWKFD